MKPHYYVILFFITLSSAHRLVGQNHAPYHRCATEHYTAVQHAQHPEFKSAAAQVHKLLTHRQKGSQASRDVVVEIPVVVHVLYRTSTENISDAQINSQIDVLNEDYRMLNANSSATIGAFSHLAADTKIQFYLATQDEAGNPTTGIIRKQTSKTGFDYTSNEAKKTALGGSDPWDVTRYLNIWVVNQITYQGIGGTLGYAQFPGLDPATDGVVIVYNAFGTVGPLTPPFDGGRTATHEVGHWLGLYHLWGQVADDGCNPSDDDLIEDTPLQSTASAGCDLGKTTCGNLNMVQNFMDYSDDDCMTLFTTGQVELMRNALMNVRSGFWPNDSDYDMALSGIIGLNDLMCGSTVSPEVQLSNNGAQSVTSIQLTASINNTQVYSETHALNLAQGEQTTIELSALPLSNGATHELEITVSNPNGQTDEVPENNSRTSSFTSAPGQLLSFQITNASKSTNVNWEIYEDQVMMKEMNNVQGTVNGELFEQHFCLADDACYEFRMMDPFISNTCSEYPEWSASTQYTAGDQFVYQGRIYEATTSIWGVDPITFAHFFNDLGECPDINPDHYFILRNETQDEELARSTAGTYSSPYTEDFCINELVTSIKSNPTSHISFYPNPTSGKLNFSREVTSVILFDHLGHEVYSAGDASTVDLPEFLHSGIYMLELQSEGELYHYQVIIR